MIKLFIMPISACQEDPTLTTIQFPFNNFDFTFQTLHDTYTLFNVNILDNFNQFHFSCSHAIKPSIFSYKPSLTLIMFSCCRWTLILAIFQRHVKKDGKRCKDSKFWLPAEHPRHGQERSASVLNLLRRQKLSLTSLPLDVHLLMVRTQQDSNPKPSDLEPCTLLDIPWQAEQLYVWFWIFQLLSHHIGQNKDLVIGFYTFHMLSFHIQCLAVMYKCNSYVTGIHGGCSLPSRRYGLLITHLWFRRTLLLLP